MPLSKRCRRDPSTTPLRREEAASCVYAPARRMRRSSATDHAWNGQPVAACGAAPSAVSETEPSPHSPRWSERPSSSSSVEAPTRRAASAYGPISHGQTVPWWYAAVALRRAPAVARSVGGIVRRERPQAERRHERSACFDDGAGRVPVGCAGERPARQRDGEQLIRAERPVVATRSVDQVEEALTVGPDEALDERRTRRLVRPAPAIGAAQPPRELEGLDPQPIHFDRLADPRRHRHAVDAGVHPRQGPPVLATAQQPVGVGADAEAGAGEVPRDDVRQRGSQLAAEVLVTRHLDVAAERVNEPERAVDGVVLERPGVGGVREHPAGERRRRTSQRLATLLGPAGREEQPLVRRHQVARPLAEPRVPGDRSRPVVLDHELVRREHELLVDRARDARPPDEPRRSLARGRDERCGGRERATVGAGRRRHLVGVARAQLDAEGSRRPEVLAVVQPAGRLLARPHAAIPGAARPPARAGDAVGALELEAVRGRLDRRVAVREALAVDAPPRAERRELEPDRSGRRTRDGGRSRPRSGRVPSRSRARGRRSRPASATAARPGRA